jgi:hypothetical protein
MAEEAQLLRPVRAFTKIRSQQTKQEVIEFLGAALEFDEACSEQNKS